MARDRFLNRGLVFPTIKRVMQSERGTVTQNTSTNSRETSTIIMKDPVTVEVANRYLEPLLATGIDTLVMGCTHYPLLRSTLREIMGDKVNLVNPAYETALELKALLEEKGLANDSQDIPAKGKYQFYVSDAANKFRRFANTILPIGVEDTWLIHIEDY